jgi:FtsH-binding integral membrane protein
LSSPQINRETVKSLLENVRELLKDEESRASSLTARGSGVIGFAGIILSLTAAVAARTGHSLHGTVRDVVTATSATAFVFLALSIVVAVRGVLLPTSSSTIAMTDIEKYPTWAVIVQEPVMVEGEIMRGLIRALARERFQNQHKARWLRGAYTLLALGLGAVTAVGVTLAVTGHLYD